MRKLVLLLVLSAATALAQGISNLNVLYVRTDPTGPCGYSYLTVNETTGALSGCVGGTWTTVGGGSGTFVQLSGDASSTVTGGATVVNGLKGVPFCTGYTPANGQFVEYTTGGSPNPCYTAAAGGTGGSMTYPTTPGIAVATGTPPTAWGTSITGLSQTLVGYLSNVTSDIQAQLNARVNLQSSAPGTQQTGNINISGVGEFDGGIKTGSSGLVISGTETAAPTTSAPTCYIDSTTHLFTCKNASNVVVGVLTTPLTSRTANQFCTYLSATGSCNPAAIAAADLPANPLPTPSGSFTISLPHGYGKCTTTCTVTVLAPTAAGDDFCVWNGVGVSTAITLAAISGVQYGKTDMSAYGTISTAATATAAAGNKICMVAPDTTHWDAVSFVGTWTMN